MNKTGFIKELEKELGYSNEKCILINDCLEENFILGKKNKEKTIDLLIEKIEVDKEEAERIYETFSNIMAREIKDKILHPFKKND